MASSPDRHARTMLPIPDRPALGLTTYDAKDPESKYPVIQQLRPPKGAPNILVILIDDAGFGSASAFGVRRSVSDAECGAAGSRWIEISPLPHDGAVFADAGGADHRTQPPLVGFWRDYRALDRLSGLRLGHRYR